jgi:3-methylfumaryl-CoA hydratase
MTDGASAWGDWVGRETRAADRIDGLRVAAMQATLDDPGPSLGDGDPLPPLWHWIYFWELTAGRGLGPEGHTALGEFLPPIDLPRRMWAGSRVEFLRPLHIGGEAERLSRIEAISEKHGRSGRLVFVTLSHLVSDRNGPAIREEQDIVYRAPADGAAAAKAGSPAPPAATWRREILPDPVLLFRYSALTFNAHRIHYDADYTRDREGYPGLIVHGPLLATLMVEQVRRERPEAQVHDFRFRALSPVFAGAPFTVAGAPDSAGADVWVADPQGALAMEGRVGFT